MHFFISGIERSFKIREHRLLKKRWKSECEKIREPELVNLDGWLERKKTQATRPLNQKVFRQIQMIDRTRPRLSAVNKKMIKLNKTEWLQQTSKINLSLVRCNSSRLNYWTSHFSIFTVKKLIRHCKTQQQSKSWSIKFKWLKKISHSICQKKYKRFWHFSKLQLRILKINELLNAWDLQTTSWFSFIVSWN